MNEHTHEPGAPVPAKLGKAKPDPTVYRVGLDEQAVDQLLEQAAVELVLLRVLHDAEPAGMR